MHRIFAINYLLSGGGIYSLKGILDIPLWKWSIIMFTSLKPGLQPITVSFHLWIGFRLFPRIRLNQIADVRKYNIYLSLQGAISRRPKPKSGSLRSAMDPMAHLYNL